MVDERPRPHRAQNETATGHGPPEPHAEALTVLRNEFGVQAEGGDVDDRQSDQIEEDGADEMKQQISVGGRLTIL